MPYLSGSVGFQQARHSRLPGTFTELMKSRLWKSNEKVAPKKKILDFMQCSFVDSIWREGEHLNGVRDDIDSNSVFSS